MGVSSRREASVQEVELVGRTGEHRMETNQELISEHFLGISGGKETRTQDTQEPRHQHTTNMNREVDRDQTGEISEGPPPPWGPSHNHYCFFSSFAVVSCLVFT